MGVINQVTPSDDIDLMNTSLRDDAIAYVQEEFDAGRVTTWSDCHYLIDEQDNEDMPAAEGMEDVVFEVVDHSESEDSGDDAELAPDVESSDDDEDASESQPEVVDGIASPPTVSEGEQPMKEPADAKDATILDDEQLLDTQMRLLRHYAGVGDEKAVRHLNTKMNEKRERKSS